MNHPPPKFRDVVSMRKLTDFVEITEQNLWEIGVPPKNSLYWSIVLSYILPMDDIRLSKFLTNIKSKTTGNKKGKETTCKVKLKGIKDGLKKFNPFMNRHVFFHGEQIRNVMTTFKQKLNQCDKKISTEENQSKDYRKLSAASNMLDCNIVVYIPDCDEIKYFSHQKEDSKEKLPSIVLFQYKDQKYGARKENINIFRFAMTVDQAHFRKISALTHILKKTQLSSDVIAQLGQLIGKEKAHGNNFLPTILQSPQYSIMPHLYKSPYIAVKLSQAGFETNPAASDPERPSALLYAMSKCDTKYIRILYDYAVNCRHLFDRTIRDADKSVLDHLERLRKIFLKDVSNLHCCKFEKSDEIRTLTIQNEYFHFLEYQQNVATAVMNLRSKLHEKSSNEDILCIRKKIVECILKSYYDFFYFKSPQTDVIYKYSNYIQFSEYYENIDNFSSLSFFDNIHLLKKIFQMKNEDIYWVIESHFFLLIVSNKFFPKFEHDVMCHSDHSKTECEEKENILRFIPLLYRENFEREIESFLKKLNLTNMTPQDKIKEENLRSSLSTFPEIKDELIISRIRTYLKAAEKVSLPHDGYKGILVIERALQVIGESLKPQTTKDCVVSCLLGSQIPFNLKTRLIDIRNNLSHYRESTCEGRLEAEEKYLEAKDELFRDLQTELKIIAESFEIVAFTQYLGLEKYLMKMGRNEIVKRQLDQSVLDNFQQEYQKRLDKQKKNCKLHRNECIKLSLAIISHLIECVKQQQGTQSFGKNLNFESRVSALLKSMEFVFMFMGKHIDRDFFQPYLKQVETFCANYKKNSNIDILHSNIVCFYGAYKVTVMKTYNVHDNLQIEFPALESFLACRKQSDISTSDIDFVIQAVERSYDEATEAKLELIASIEAKSFNVIGGVHALLQKLIISQDSFEKLKNYFGSATSEELKPTLQQLKKKWISKDSLEEKVRKMFQDNSTDDNLVKVLLLKIANQRNLENKIYTSVTLQEDICLKLEKILTRKTQFLLTRVMQMKSVLIDEDEDVKEAWEWGRSKEMKHHMKFLMRQRFLREIPVRVSLELAFFDCLNILEKEQFCDIYEKMNNLFTGIDLRNVLSHGHGVLETIGGLLDEEDLPSEMINKMLHLIEDSDAIREMQKLVPTSNTLYEEDFKLFIKNNSDEAVKEKFEKKYKRWENYLFLLPLISNAPSKF